MNTQNDLAYTVNGLPASSTGKMDSANLYDLANSLQLHSEGMINFTQLCRVLTQRWGLDLVSVDKKKYTFHPDVPMTDDVFFNPLFWDMTIK